MKITYEKNNDVLNIIYYKSYDLFTIESIMDLLKNNILLKNIKNVVVDCTLLENIDSCGGEIFLLKKQYNIDNIVFYNLNNELHSVLNEFSNHFFNEDLLTTDKLDNITFN